MSALDERVATGVAGVRARIAAAGGAGVEIMAVTKTWEIDAAFAAHRAGCSAIGENYAQEVGDKLAGVERPFEVHFIGQLQTNKVRRLVGLVDVFASVDRTSLVDEIATRVPGARVLIQIAGSGEAGKGGCPIGGVPALVARAGDAGLVVRGLMVVGPTYGGAEAARPVFRTARAMVTELGLAVCSMGMTADLDVAVEEGSTQVRVGSALFGERHRPR